MIFCGIGSRKTPEDILVLMTKIGSYLGQKGFILRSGHAIGADLAFENGCDFVNGKKEIFLPWKGYNGSHSLYFTHQKETENLAAQVHPAWHYCKPAVRKLHSRNCQIILGKDLKSPSNFVICWTMGGALVGGTAIAIKLAQKNNVPVYNLYNKEDKNRLDEFLKNL